MKTRQVYINGKFVSEDKASVSIYDSALMFGDTVFEMTRSFNKKQFKLNNHIDRLYNGLKILRIPIKLSKQEMIDAINEVIEINDPLFSEDDEHRIMINVTRGVLSLYREVIGIEPGPKVIIADFPLKWTVKGMGHLFDTGINAVIPSQRAIPAELLDPKIKNRSRIHYLMANIQVSQMKGSDNWALLLDPDGYIAEGTGDNFFIVKNGVVITPEGRNILRGISREYVFELCEKISIPCVEKNIDPYDVYTSDEAFMTGTPFCMLPVTKLNGVSIGDGNVGIIFKRIIREWSSTVGLNIIEQIKGYEKGMSKASDGVSPYSFSGK
jgi:branched-chain amino acid aminotransferase